VDEVVLDTFCRRHGVRRLAVFGSVLGERFSAGSDVDVLIEFEPGRVPGLVALSAMELELEEQFGRKVDLRTYGDLSRYFRDDVRARAKEIYAA
jgi:predicted nucleotidyltransferase